MLIGTVRRRHWIRPGAAWMVLLFGTWWMVRSQGEQPAVGYAVLTVEQGASPVAGALFSFRNPGGVLVAEAGVQAVGLLNSGRIFVDETRGKTGLALANPNSQEAAIRLFLRDLDGDLVASGEEPLLLGAGQHRARFIEQLFEDLPTGFIGTLTFETEPGSPPVAAVTLRQALNGRREPLLATLPVVPLAPAAPHEEAAEAVVFPHLGAGSGSGLRLTTQIVLLNPGGTALEGRLRFRDSAGRPLELRSDAGEEGSQPAYRLAPHGAWTRTFMSTGGLVEGFALVVPETGPMPAGTAIFQFRDSRGDLVSEAGVGATLPTTQARIFVDTASTRTGLALANPGDSPAAVSFQLFDRGGFPLRRQDRVLGAGRHTSEFVDEILTGLPEGLTGILQIESTQPLAPVSLKLTVNRRGDLILTTLPVADLTRPLPAGLLVMPQIGFGLGFSTRLILLNQALDEGASGRIALFRSDGSPMDIALPGGDSGAVEYRLGPGAALQLRPGNTAPPAAIVNDIFNPSEVEIALNRGASVRLHPVVVDAEGAFRDDLAVQLQSSDSEVADIDGTGMVRGLEPGFSTLFLSAGNVVSTVTLAVVGVNQGGNLLDVVGIAGDAAGRFYLASNSRHVVTRAESLQDTPRAYAGSDGQAGFRNQTRLTSLFNQPAFLVYNQGDGSLYVSDSANHVIRRILPGALDQVETFAGTGDPGRTDGARLESAFRRPLGLTLDGRGRLWIADSGNHTIRRLDLVTGEVTTVAGVPGIAGFRDGRGGEARFAEPSGLALEEEPLLVRLDRELRGLPPPPVTVIVADSGNGVLRRVRDDGQVETIGIAAPAAPTDRVRPRLRFNGIRDAIVDAVGNIFVGGDGRVRVVLPDGTVVNGAQPGTFTDPGGITTGMDGRVVVADPMGAVELEYGPPVIASVEPGTVSSSGGRIVVRGKNFSQDTLVVAAARILRGFQILTTNEMEIQIPPLPSGVTTLSLQNRGGIAQAPVYVRPTDLGDLPVGHITTVAGGSTFIGDGRRPLEASLFTPQGLAVDSRGNLYIADLDNFRVRRIDTRTGLIVTVAGTGEERTGPAPDGIPAITADLGHPEKLAVDGAGNFFLSGFGETAISRVEAQTGLIRPAVPIFGFHEIAADTFGNLYFSEMFEHRVRRWRPQDGTIETVAGNGARGSAGDGGPAVEASLARPRGVAVDSAGNLFIIEDDSRRVRRVDAQTGIITTVASGLSEGEGLTVDGEGNLYAGGFGGRLIQIQTGTGGARTVGMFPDTRHLAADALGNLYVSDPEANVVLRVDPATGTSLAVAGMGGEPDRGDGGEAAAAIMLEPIGLAFGPQGDLIVADSRDQRIRRVRAGDQIVTTIAGTGRIGHIQPPDGVPALEASLFFPGHVAVDAQGDVFFAGGTLWRIDRRNGRMSMLLEAANVQGLTLDPEGNPVFSNASDQVVRLNLASGGLEVIAGTGPPGFAGDGGPAVESSLWVPLGVAYDGRGNLYIADLFNSRVRCVSGETGLITTVAGGGTILGQDNVPATEVDLFPRDVAVDDEGNLFILEAFAVRQVDAQTGLIRTVARSRGPSFNGDNGPALQAGFQVEQIEIGPDGNLYLADARNHRVRAVRLH